MWKEENSPKVVGTPDYLAPEVLLALGHDFTVDWWALGIILYEFLVGIPPFYAETTSDIFQNILQGDIRWPEGDEQLSPEAVDLITKLLTEKPIERLGVNGVAEVKNHPFFDSINWNTLLQTKPPFIPGEIDPNDMTMYFEDRQQFWPLVEEDFGDIYEDENEIRKSNDEYNDFWCINVSNLKEKNYEILQETIAQENNKI